MNVCISNECISDNNIYANIKESELILLANDMKLKAYESLHNDLIDGSSSGYMNEDEFLRKFGIK